MAQGASADQVDIGCARISHVADIDYSRSRSRSFIPLDFCLTALCVVSSCKLVNKDAGQDRSTLKAPARILDRTLDRPATTRPWPRLPFTSV